MTREPGRSRILVIAGLILAAAQGAIYVWATSLPPESPWGYAGLISTFVPLGVAFIAWIPKAGKIFVTPLSRPARFEVRAGTFRLEPRISPGFAPLAQLAIYGMLLGLLVTMWREPTDPDPFGAKVLLGMYVFLTVVMALWTMLIAAMIVTTWNAGPIHVLTPGGIRSRTMLASFFVPWEALYTGGPPRPAPSDLTASALRLAVARPELVQVKGLFLAGSRVHPLLGVDSYAHPWLLADAIRWYAEHPEHRAGIGTQEEHDRLISAVTADYPRLDAARPPRPRLVTWAVWVAVAGAWACVLLSAANLYIAVAFEDRIAAATLVVADGEGSLLMSPVLPAVWFGLMLLGALLTLIAARGVWRGRPGARIGMLVLFGLLVTGAVIGSCFGSSSVPLLEVPGQEMLGIVLVALWLALQSLAFGVGVAVFVLLQLPAASDYFKPRYLSDPAVVKV